MAHVIHYRRSLFGRKIKVTLTRNAKKQIKNSKIFAEWLTAIAKDPLGTLNRITPAPPTYSCVGVMKGFQFATSSSSENVELQTQIWELDSNNETIEDPHCELPFKLVRKALEEIIIYERTRLI